MRYDEACNTDYPTMDVKTIEGSLDARQEDSLGVVRLVRNARLGDRRDGNRVAGVRPAKGLEMVKALRARHEPRVGDSVRGAREQIREAHGLTQVSGQDAEGEIEASTDPLENAAEQIAS